MAAAPSYAWPTMHGPCPSTETYSINFVAKERPEIVHRNTVHKIFPNNRNTWLIRFNIDISKHNAHLFSCGNISSFIRHKRLYWKWTCFNPRQYFLSDNIPTNFDEVVLGILTYVSCIFWRIFQLLQQLLCYLSYSYMVTSVNAEAQ